MFLIKKKYSVNYLGGTILKIAILSAANSIHTVRIVNALSTLGHEVRLYSLASHEAKANEILSDIKIEYLVVPSGIGYFTGGKLLCNYLREFQPDILNAHYASGYGTLAVQSEFHPLVLSVWGSDVYDFPYKNFICRALLKRNLKHADTLASTSHIMAKQTRKFLSPTTKERPIYVTPFGVDTELFSPDSNNQNNKNEFHIGFVKIIAEKYGLRYLLEAFSIVKKENDTPYTLKLDIYGDGPQMNEMIKLAKNLDDSRDIIFHGRIPNTAVPNALRKMDVFCIPSTLDSESFGVSAVEAMSCQIPVLASDVDGLTEVVKTPEVFGLKATGIIIPRKNAEALAENLSLLIRSESLRTRLGKNGRNHVLENYDFSQNILTLVNAFKETVR